MRKKKIIISIVVVLCVLVGVFFIMRFGVIGKIKNTISHQLVQDTVFLDKDGNEIDILTRVPSEGPEEFEYLTLHDKDGNEVVIEMRKVMYTNQHGKEVESWEETAVKKILHNIFYSGKITKIEDNKIYFLVDTVEKFGEGLPLEDVEDYEIIFDIDTYDLEVDPHVGYEVYDSLEYDDTLSSTIDSHKRFSSAGELEFLVGKYVILQDHMVEDPYIDGSYKTLFFQLVAGDHG